MESKEKLKELLENVKKDGNLVDEYINAFNGFWNIKKDKNTNMNLLKNIYNNFVNYSFKSTNADKFLTNNLANVIDELTNTFSDEQKRIYEIFDFINMEYIKMQEFRAFIFAFCFSNEIRKETNSFKRNNKFKNIKRYKNYNKYSERNRRYEKY